jgi:hypothetical protein
VTQKVRRYVWVLVPFLFGAIAGSARAQVACPQPWSSGSPAVKAQHIFCGEINAKGRAVGFHSRPDGRDPATVAYTGDTRPDPRHPGIYAINRFLITENGRTEVKTLSTMFPDRCDKAAVIAAIQHAYAHGTRTGDGFTGPSGPTCTDDRGQTFRIQGFTGTQGGSQGGGSQGGRTVIMTAYPN